MHQFPITDLEVLRLSAQLRRGHVTSLCDLAAYLRHWLRDERYTIEGARRALKERGLDDDANAPAKPEALRAALVHARERLAGLLDALDALRPPARGVQEPDMSTAPEIHVTETELEGDLAARDETA